MTKILSITPLGKKKTFNLSMRSKHHNYLLNNFSTIVHRNSHAVAYSIITYRCLYLKAHYPAEWWAAVMTECNPLKLPNYMGAARLEKVQFGTLDVNNLSENFSVAAGRVVPGLSSIKGIGQAAAKRFTEVRGPFTGIDQVVEQFGKDKRVFERLIKLGAFDLLHPNRRGLWVWYQYKYCSGKDITQLRNDIDAKTWPLDRIEEQRKRHIANFQRSHPGRKLPAKVSNWKPKREATLEEVLKLVLDYTPGERIELEREMLGYYWSSPLDMYVISSGDTTVEGAKTKGLMEAVVDSVQKRISKKTGKPFYILRVTDGLQSADITIWQDIFETADPRMFEQGAGIRIAVDYDYERKNFKISNNGQLAPLILKGSSDERLFTDACFSPSIEPCSEPLW